MLQILLANESGISSALIGAVCKYCLSGADKPWPGVRAIVLGVVMADSFCATWM